MGGVSEQRSRTGLGAIVACTVVLASAGSVGAVDVPISGKVGLVRSARLVKLVSESAQQPGQTPFLLPVAGGSEDPTLVGASLSVADLGVVGGTATYTLDASGWRARGDPPGSRGYVYKGKDDTADPNPRGTCRVVVLNEKRIKAVCKDDGLGAVPLTTPFQGSAAVQLEMPPQSRTLRYCAELGGDEIKNDAKKLKRKNAATPTVCRTICGNGFIDPGEDCESASDCATGQICTGCTCSPSCSALGGFDFDGACWFGGDLGASCNDVCAAQGLLYDEATRTVAGSDGTASNCGDIITALSGQFVTFVLGTSSGGVGCHVLSVQGGFLPLRDMDPTTSTATGEFVGRVCACQ